MKAKEVQALKDGKLEKNLKSANVAREELSKELVQATSEMTNKKSALAAEVEALEAVKKVRVSRARRSRGLRCIDLLCSCARHTIGKRGAS